MEKQRKPGRAEEHARDASNVEERATPATPVIYEVVRRHGEDEMARPSLSLWWSGVAAGLSISFSLLAQAVMSIQAVKGVEIGDGFDVAGRRGSAAHDAIRWDAETNQYRRETTLAGGVEGGISTGELLVVRAAMKPLATLNVPVLETVDTATKEPAVSFKERTDVTAVPAMGVVAETMVALGTDAGTHTVALLTDMSTPLGLTAGNALEVRESVATAKGSRSRTLIRHHSSGTIMLTSWSTL